MSKRIEDYALIGDRRSAALVARDGAIDWLCWPHFDSDACFAALLGDERHGRWKIAPRETPRHTCRRYCGDTLILETRHETAAGIVRVTDLMPITTAHRAVIREITGEGGEVEMVLDLALCFDYGSISPWLRFEPRVVRAVVGPDLVVFRSPIDICRTGQRIVAEFIIGAGECATFTLQYGLSQDPEPLAIEPSPAIAATAEYWKRWTGRCTVLTDWPDAVKRSLITLQALSDAETGGIIAAPTTSLPEIPGGARNWDYRYTWLRDSTFTLSAFLNAGYREEARAWRDWLLRAAAGAPEHLRTMYRADASRHIDKHDLPWLQGYDSARPVRVGNSAAHQFQLDIYGEVLDSLHLCAQVGLDERPWDIAVEQAIAAHLEEVWERPDQGMWESRGPPQHFTHSKAMAWVGIDRFLKLADIDPARRRKLERLRENIHRQICRDGFNPARNSFVQSFGSEALDASLLLLPLVGFLPIDDPRIRGTIAAIEEELIEDRLVRRWPRTEGPAEGAFLACTCWLADCLAMQGRTAEARAYFERVLALRNDVGLLSEEWDTRRQRMLGNFPQALSHLAVINTALGLCGPVLERGA
ncbi:MAG: glycoside hydrolase family 15 protein [Stellaceae bacterium]